MTNASKSPPPARRVSGPPSTGADRGRGHRLGRRFGLHELKAEADSKPAAAGAAGHAGLGRHRRAARRRDLGRVLRPPRSGRARRRALARRRRGAGGAFPRRRAGEAGRPAGHHRSGALRGRGRPRRGAGRRGAGARRATRKSEHERAQRLLDEQAIAQRELDERVNAQREAEANLRAAQAALQTRAAEPRLHAGARAGRRAASAGSRSRSATWSPPARARRC